MATPESELHIQKEQLNKRPILEVRGLTKRFPGVVALNKVDFSIYPGEIHALLGENGAGKTTLMNILYGLYQSDEGEILINGKPFNPHSPQEAIEAGIGMVHQDFRLIPSLTVTENVILGDRGQSFWFSTKKANVEVRNLSERYGLPIDPAVKVADLPVGLQQRTAILKALRKEAEILILDEPTSVLTPQETELLFFTLERMKQEGKTIIFITHKLQEVLNIADRITVLRKGKHIATVKTSEVDQNRLAVMMIGREINFGFQKEETVPGEVVLSLENIFTDNDDAKGLKGVSFQLRRGETLGIAGVAGNGQTDLAEVITGLRRIRKGVIGINGQRLTKLTPSKAIGLGLTHIPEDRHGMGVASNLPVKDNLILRRFRQPPFNVRGLLNNRKISEFGHRLIDQFNISTPRIETPIRTLSGGNLQKVIVGREIDACKGILVANLPTQGLDVAATAFIRKLLSTQQLEGQSVLLISQDLDELMAISDRIGIMFEGKMFGPFPKNGITREEIGLMMAGINSKQ